MNFIADVLIIGAGPAALAIASELCQRGLQVEGLASISPEVPWENTYGIWGSEVDDLCISSLLSHRWSDCTSYFTDVPIPHKTDYGLFDKNLLKGHWLSSINSSKMVWHLGEAAYIEHSQFYSSVTTTKGLIYSARLIIEATGHQSRFISRPTSETIAYQTAYGVIGRFSEPPLKAGQLVLMDYRQNNLNITESNNPVPTFLYAMDLGEGVFFLEETSLAFSRPVSYSELYSRLYQRLTKFNISILEVKHEEFCLFPMNLPLPNLKQQVIAFGSAASMVHPSTGYMIGTLMRRAPILAEAIANNLSISNLSSTIVAERAWASLWSDELIERHMIFQFGLEKLMRFSHSQLFYFFDSFFKLPLPQWSGFLANTLSMSQLVGAMIRLWVISPWIVKWGLMRLKGKETELALKSIFIHVAKG
uniref:lycopene beta-cyclase n=1 Tax=Paulinella chromatophora TaxID=39717 RepID=B1X5H1_PAUCH|nr:lycopene cyclase [Paulinella chromatophora]ACB43190.1 lycopene cyclase [Paulinella chromatophora]